MELAHSEASERNKEPILQVLREVLGPHNRRLFEVGAGTGQHAVHMAPFFPQLEWTPTDRAANLPGLKQRVAESQISNIRLPHVFEVGADDIPMSTYDVIYTANTFHIMHWKECKTLMKLMSHRLPKNGKVLIYGPFNYQGQFTSPSNEAFDQSLKERDPLSGIRAFEDVHKAMLKHGFELVKDHDMPANNRLLVFNRLAFVRKQK